MQAVIFLIVVGIIGITAIGERATAPLGFFEQIGETWVSGAGQDFVLLEEGGKVLVGEPTPIVMRILYEVQHGWTADTILDLWGPIYPFLIFCALIAGVGCLYCAVRIFQIRRVEHAAFRTMAHPVVSQDTSHVQLRWRGILDQVASDDPQKWRTAVLEADQLLSDLLDVLGFKGETMSDKMRKVDVAAFNSIDYAWEAHQIRDRLARDPSFALDAREAKRVIRMYERVFKEFKYIPNE